MATLDGYNPYPIGLTAAETVAALKRAHVLETTLQEYGNVLESTTAPSVTEVYNHSTFWYNPDTGRLYRGYWNEESSIVVWFEID